MFAGTHYIDSGRQLNFRTATWFYGNVAHYRACYCKHCNVHAFVCRIVYCNSGTLYLNRNSAFHGHGFCRDRSAKRYACADGQTQCQRENVCGYFFHG